MIPVNSSGAFLGLFNNSTALNNDTNNQVVAVEFDTFPNQWDPSQNHVGIDVCSIRSATHRVWDTSLANNEIANAWVSYNSSTTTLSVYLTYKENPVFQGNHIILSHVVDLKKVLPEWVNVGFSAATGSGVEIHNIVSWNFNSTLEDGVVGSPTLAPLPTPSTGPPLTPPSTDTGHKMNLRLVFGLAVSIGTLSCGVGLFWFMKRKKINSRGNNDMGIDASTDDDDFEKGTGPRRFTFSELRHATNNFSEGGKLGEGGFGGVYKGVLSDGLNEIAVKRISKGSKQGKKEFKSEVKIISRLRHRNLVQLIGFNVEKVQYKNVVFTVWDVGGQEKLRPLWRHYFNNTDGLGRISGFLHLLHFQIYVVDSLDRERIGKAKQEFQAIIRDSFMLNSIILMFANKQDMVCYLSNL
ncbi:hypothetical protein RHGRI_022458 [Rhododendron griersonianum]|uniref:non-specific serine/threonine protein kinase n=1 Tax=Rhododendron griersonianum TaxID=479676 RepID=A0AAV6J1A6_9ERIC|nr:hypothetical protein RHGRI_022458 [Rhododendron griersonianum]